MGPYDPTADAAPLQSSHQAEVILFRVSLRSHANDPPSKIFCVRCPAAVLSRRPLSAQRGSDPLSKTVAAHSAGPVRPFLFRGAFARSRISLSRDPLPACARDPLIEDRVRPSQPASSLSKLAAARHGQGSSFRRRRNLTCRITARAILFRRSPPHLRQHDAGDHLAMIPLRHAPETLRSRPLPFEDSASCRLDITFRARLSTFTLVLASPRPSMVAHT